MGMLSEISAPIEKQDPQNQGMIKRAHKSAQLGFRATVTDLDEAKTI